MSLRNQPVVFQHHLRDAVGDVEIPPLNLKETLLEGDGNTEQRRV
ncbi:hypothetical protein [Halalkalirubrum salinum]|nr:hypothetical protein [Halalkalirubrum salinum]